MSVRGRASPTLRPFAQHLRNHNGAADNITSVAIDMSPAFIKGVPEQLPKAVITFDKFHVVAHASSTVDAMRRIEQKTDPALKGLRWTLLKDRRKLSREQANDLDHLVACFTTTRAARAWLYREQLRDIPFRKRYHVVSVMLHDAPTSCAPRSRP
jgi:transposase